VRARERAYVPERREREPTRAAKRVRPEPEEEKVNTAARTPAAKEKDAHSENSSIAAIAKAFDASAATAKADAKASDSENSSVAVVSELVAIAKAEAKKADSENSSIAGVVVERKIERAENSSISVASITASESAAATETAKPAAPKTADCKKFVSSVGMIVSVSCD
jgi:hypothetical protein